MKVALITERLDAHASAAERLTLRVAGELRERGCDLTLITAIDGPYGPAPGFTVRTLLPGVKRIGWARQRQFVRLAEREMPSGGYDATLSLTTSVAADVLRPSSLIRDTPARWSLKRQVMLKLEAEAVRDSGCVAAVSEMMAARLQSHYHVRSPILANPPSFAPVDAAATARWRGEIRTGFNVPNDAMVYLFAGENGQRDGLDAVLQGLFNVPAAILLVAAKVGYAYQHAAAAMGVRDRVRFIGGASDMASLYAAADVTVHPSWYDPAGQALIDSLSTATPAIVTTYVGGSAQVAAGCGRVVEDADGVVEAMTQLADADERQRCRAACEGMNETWSMTRHVDELHQRLTEAAGR